MDKFDPQKLYLGVMDVFAVLMPGAVLALILITPAKGMAEIRNPET